MSIKELNCLEVRCDGCADGWSDEDYGVPHFPADEALEDQLADWNWTAVDGKHYCRQCSAERECEATGHAWTTLPEKTFEDRHYPALTLCDRCNQFQHEAENQ